MSTTSKIIKLSVNPDVVRTKKEGKWKKSYEVISYDLNNGKDIDRIRTMLQTNNHSVNCWNKAGRLKTNYIGLTGIALDYDNDPKKNKPYVSLEEGKERFSRYNSIIYTTSSHKVDGKTDKFRVILPFNLSNGDIRFQPYEEGRKVYEYLKQSYPDADESCFEPARQYFPFTGNNKIFECYINSAGEWYDIDEEKIKSIILDKPLPNQETFSLDDELTLAKGARWNSSQWENNKHLKIREISNHTPIFCPFCDDTTRGADHGASAFIDVNARGVHYIFCSHCKSITGNGTYWLDEKDKIEAVGLFAFRTFDGRYFIKNSQDAFQEFGDRSQINVEFMKAGLPAPTILDNYGMSYDFSSDASVVEDRGFKIINSYKAPDVMRTPANASVRPDKFPIIWAWSKHICPVESEHSVFMQWLARIIRDRVKLRTSWIFMGLQGCGKSKFFEFVVGGIIGPPFICTVTNVQLKEKYNEYLIEGVFHIYEEIASDKSDRIHVKNKIKLHVTEDKVPVREMWSGTKQRVKVISNCVFLSNENTPIELDTPDRRFNVVRCTEREITECPWYVDDLRIPVAEELPYFVAYLKSLPTSWDVMNKTIDNAEKRKLQEQVLEHKDIFWKALYDPDATSLNNIYEPPAYSSFSATNRMSIDFAELAQEMKAWKEQKYVTEARVKRLLDDMFINYKKYGIGITKLPHYFSRSTGADGEKVLKFK